MKKLVIRSFLILLFIYHSAFGQNNFENGNTPSVFRHFQEHQIMPGYNQFMIQVEGMDILNFFGKRLVDRTEDGKEDIVLRTKEYLEGDWDYSSVPMRPFIYLNFNEALEPELIVNPLHLHDAPNLLYHESANGEKFYYNFQAGDPSRVDQFGVENVKEYLESYGIIEDEHYWRSFNIGGNSFSDEIEYTPRIMKTAGEKLFDVTDEVFQFDSELQNSNQKYSWDKVVGVGDYDADGDKDVLMVGNADIGNNPNFTNHDNTFSRNAFFFMENQGDGSLVSSVYDYVPSDGLLWYNEYQGISIAENFDDDPADELLMVMLYYDENVSVRAPEKTKLGYINVDKESKSISFEPILNADEFLENPNWSIKPDFFQPIEYDSYPNRSFILSFFTSEGGSPVENITGETDFTLGVPQQYFKVYEKIIANGTTELVDQTSLFFEANENQTLSLDDDGSVYLIDLDNDGDLDIFPQQYFGIRPNQGGLDQFLNYPNWRYDPNQIYYFENIGDRYKLSNWNTINHLFPSNFDSTTDFSLFNDNGEVFTATSEIFIDEVFVGNRVSVNDLDKDGQYEFITASNPDYMAVMTKSEVNNNPSVFNLGFEHLEMEASFEKTQGFLIRYAHLENNFFPQADSLNLNYDSSYNFRFIMKDEERILTHQPNNRSILLSESSNQKVLYKLYPTHAPQSPLENPLDRHEIIYYNLDENPIVSTENKEITFPVSMRIDNDIYHKTIPLKIIDQNTPPYPFKLISEDNETPDKIKLSFYSSFDYNLNSHQGNENYAVRFKPEGDDGAIIDNSLMRIPGPQYGYRIIDENGEILQEIKDLDYTIALVVSNDQVISIIEDFEIDTSNIQAASFRYEVFAADTQNSSIETLMTNCNADGDQDGVNDCDDLYPDDPYASFNDINGNKVFNLPQENFSILIENLSCIGENDGEISIQIANSDFDYQLSLNGDISSVFNNSNGYQQSLSNLSAGEYQLCFTVEGQGSYLQCFDLVISEPEPLSASSKVDEKNKSISFELSGATNFTIIHNGVSQIVDTTKPTLQLKEGLNRIEIKTDKGCQGIFTQEVFVSKRVEFYPNPTKNNVFFYIHGQDSFVDLSVVDINGKPISTITKEIPANRKIEISLEELPKGIYLINISGPTVQKAIKIVKE